MDIERFHNELAMRLGYERIVKDKRILIFVEESDNPLVMLTIDGSVEIRLLASEKLPRVESLKIQIPDMRDEIKLISDAAHHAYIESTRELFSCFR